MNHFQMKQNKKFRLLVSGEPGSGKTTFLKKLANEWGTSKLEESQEYANQTRKLSVFADFELLLLCVLRFISPGSSMFEILRHQFDFLTSIEMYACIDILEKAPEKCMLLFDGLDEFVGNSDLKEQTFRIIAKDKFPKMLCCTTSRPETIKHLRGVSKEGVQENVKLAGFNDVQVEQYAKLYLEDENMTQSFMNHITKEKPQFLELSRIPMRAEMMVILWKEFQSLGNSLNDLYSKFTKYILQHMEKKMKEKHGLTLESDVIQKYHELLQLVSKIAYSWNKDGTLKITFTEHELKLKLDKSFTRVTKSGFLSHTESRSPQTPSQWFFTHLSIQEYFVAFYLKINDKCKQIMDNFVYGCVTSSGLKSRSYILEFLFGLSTKTACNILTTVVKKYNGDNEKLLDILVSFTKQFGHLEEFRLSLPSKITISNSSPKEIFRLIDTDQHSRNSNLKDLTVLLSNGTPDLSHAFVTSLTLEIEDGCNISKWKCNLPNLQDLTIKIKSNKTTSETNLDFDCLLRNIKSDKIRKVCFNGQDITSVILNNLEKLKNVEFVDLKDETQDGMKDTEQLELSLNKLRSISCSSRFVQSSAENVFLRKNENIVCSKVEANFIENLGDFLIKRSQQGHEAVKVKGFIFNQSDVRNMASSVASILLHIELKVFGLQECLLDKVTLKTVCDILNIVGKKFNYLKVLDLSGSNLDSFGLYTGQCLRFLPDLDTLLLKHSNVNEKDLADMSNGYFNEQSAFLKNTVPLPIKYLDLSGNTIKEIESKPLLFCPELTTLILKKCQLRGKLFTLLKKLCSTNITSLNLCGMDLSEEDTFSEIFIHFHNLKDINLCDCNLAGQLAKVIRDLPAQVTHLDISGQRDISHLVTSDHMQKKLSHLHQLTLPSTSQDTEKLRWLLTEKNTELEVIVSETEKDEPNVEHGFNNIWQKGKYSNNDK